MRHYGGLPAREGFVLLDLDADVAGEDEEHLTRNAQYAVTGWASGLTGRGPLRNMRAASEHRHADRGQDAADWRVRTHGDLSVVGGDGVDDAT